MYELHFGLKRRPFSAAPTPDCCAPVGAMPAGFEKLRLCLIGGQGIGILTAPAGTGKTLLCRKLVREFRQAYRPAFLPCGGFATRRSLLQAILYELGRPYQRMGEQELRLELTTAVKHIRSERKGVILIIDEAHLLPGPLLEEIRMATNLAEGDDPLVRVLLSGQLALEERLAGPDLAAFSQRIRCHATLEPLTRQESAEYIAYHFQWAGGDIAEILDPEALDLICRASDGLPRCLNQLCDQTLLLAHASGERPAGAATVRRALDELKQLPLAWSIPLPSEGEPPEQWTARREPADWPASSGKDSGEFEVGAEGRSTSGDVDDWSGSATGCIEVGADDDLVSHDDRDRSAASVPRPPATPLPEAGAQAKTHAPTGGAPPISPAACSVKEPAESRVLAGDIAGWEPVELKAVTRTGLRGPAPELVRRPVGTEEFAAVFRNIGGDHGDSRFACTATAGFGEELVVDRYAALDAVLASRRRISRSSSAGGSRSLEQSSASGSSGGRRPRRLRPDQVLDEIMPMLTAVLSPDLDLELDAPPRLVTSSLDEGLEDPDDGIAERIGAAALDACLEVQHAIAARHESWAGSAIDTAPRRPAEVVHVEAPAPLRLADARFECEVVLPEERATAGAVVRDDFPTGERPSPDTAEAPRYGQLFTELRRRVRS